jgi:RHS repeat-associated protein
MHYVRGAGGETVAVYKDGSREFVNLLAGSEIIGTWDGTQRRYFLKDHLGSIRTTVDASGNVDGYDDYYPFGLVMAGPDNSDNSPISNYKFTGYEQDDEAGLNLYHANARGYDPVLGRFMQIDPYAAKYPNLSPYSYVANNPLVFVDPTGMVIEICNGSGDERNCVTYEAGMEYEGDDQFISQAVGVLNNINSVEHGASVLENLISSENFFNFENVASERGDKTFQFVPNEEGGGTIRAASLLNSELGGFSRIESAAHELFHGYQHENGGIQGVNSEVGAYLYGRGVAATFNDGMTPGFQGNIDNPAAGDSYSSAINNLLFGGSFIPASYSTAIQNFKQGSGVNATGLYGSKVYPVSSNPPIRQFFPLVRYKN